MGIYGYIWVNMGIYGVYGDNFRHIWVYMGIYRGKYGYIWVYMGVYMGIYGCIGMCDYI